MDARRAPVMAGRARPRPRRTKWGWNWNPSVGCGSRVAPSASSERRMGQPGIFGTQLIAQVTGAHSLVPDPWRIGCAWPLQAGDVCIFSLSLSFSASFPAWVFVWLSPEAPAATLGTFPGPPLRPPPLRVGAEMSSPPGMLAPKFLGSGPSTSHGPGPFRPQLS